MSDIRPDLSRVPRHVAIIMDGNGRWAAKRHLPRIAGHRAGVSVVENVVRLCGQRGIETLTLFAFSSENWRRPAEEVGLLMNLFVTAMEQQVKRLHQSNVCLQVIGDRDAFSEKLRNLIVAGEHRTQDNFGLKLNIAANYGGRRDITEAARTLAEKVRIGELDPVRIDEQLINDELSLSGWPEPDLFIRTGGEQRISNFLLWQLAYTELHFTDVLWPDFDEACFDEALESYASRQRRFGRTGEQVSTRRDSTATSG